MTETDAICNLGVAFSDLADSIQKFREAYDYHEQRRQYEAKALPYLIARRGKYEGYQEEADD